MPTCRWGLFVLFAVAIPAAADTVEFQNGDRLTGVFLELREGRVRFDADVVGEVSLPVETVFAVTTAEPVAVQQADGQWVEGLLVYTESGQALAGPAGTTPLALESVAVAGPPEALAAAAEVPGPAEPEAEAAPKKWAGNVQAGAIWQSGTTNKTDLNLGAKAERTWTNDVLTLTADWAYGEVESETNTRRVGGSARLQHYWSDRFYSFALGTLEHEPTRKLELRAEAALGAGYEFIKNERRTLSADAGFSYAVEYWTPYDLVGYDKARQNARNAFEAQLLAYLRGLPNNPGLLSQQTLEQTRNLIQAWMNTDVDNDPEKIDRVNLRLGAYFEQVLFERSKLVEELTVLPDLTNSGEYRLNSKLSFVTPLADKLQLRLTLKTDYDSQTAADGSDRFDNTFMANLQYDF